MLSAKSNERFPSLRREPFCPWHEDCTAMDCENFAVRPRVLHKHSLSPTPANRVVDAIATTLSAPIKPSKKGKRR